MADYIEVISEDIDPSLIGPAAMDRLWAVARQLPPLSFAGFECRLAADDPRVDLQVNLNRVRVPFSEALLVDPVWVFLDRLTGDWVGPRSDLYRHLNGVFMEFDLDGPPTPVPSLFFALRDGLASAHIVLSRLAEILPRVPDLQHALARLLSDLPPGAALANIGVMLGRTPPVCRARVTGLQIPDIEAFPDVGRDGAAGGWSTALGLAESADAAALLVDVLEDDAPRAGLELFFDRQHPSEQRWWELLDRLVDLGACSEDKRDALLEWPGAVSMSPDRWPAAISWGDRLLAGRAVSLFWRRVNHVKVTPESDGTLSAKAYLAFGHNWIDRGVARRMAKDFSRHAP
jgi:hypothetical protein